VPLANSRTEDAVSILRQFHSAAATEFSGRDTETDAILHLWADTLDRLATDPMQLVGRVDWITKRWLFEQFIERENLSWSDPWLKSQDLEFHQVETARNLAHSLATTPPDWQLSPQEIQRATHEPPADTRAQARSRLMQMLKSHTVKFFVDWEVIDAEGVTSLNLLDPFDPQPEEAETWARELLALTSGDA
jgi:proteasome accessory factor A